MLSAFGTSPSSERSKNKNKILERDFTLSRLTPTTVYYRLCFYSLKVKEKMSLK
jgi:hypothetical protein